MQFSVYPADWKQDTTYRPASKPAKEYPFTLDPFQKQAIQYIERNESVLVSAHTSAGKVRLKRVEFWRCARSPRRLYVHSRVRTRASRTMTASSVCHPIWSPFSTGRMPPAIFMGTLAKFRACEQAVDSGDSGA